MAKPIPQCVESAPTIPADLLELVQGVGGGSVAYFPTYPNAGAKKGVRNNSTFRYACSLRARGVSWEEAELLIKQFAIKCTPPLPGSEAITCLYSAWKYQSAYPLTDVGNAQRLLILAEGNYRYCPEKRSWLFWTGSSWSLDNTGKVVELAKSIMDLITVEAKNCNDEY